MPTALYRRSLLLALSVSVTLLASGRAGAADFDSYEELGVFRDWVAYSGMTAGQKVCFAESRPQKLDRGVSGRHLRAVRVTVTNRPADRVKGEVVIETGVPIATGTFADADIDERNYKLATEPSGMLWLPTREEAALVAAMRRGITMVTKVTSGGRSVSDSYSLRGFTAAMRAIDAACG
ncbi:MAG: hypothetical protein GDA36_13770 [Rhodobacteraceae bacterium]|nr:hypothetical protein [Paracoccaceae bacterium]